MTAKLARPQYFTAASANRMLPLVRAIVQDIVELSRDLQEREQRLDDLRVADSGAGRRDGDLYSEEVEQMQRDIEHDSERLKGYVRELEKLGVEFKDPVKGLVDFPTVIDGKDAFLCWRLGEPEVGFWHPLDGGFLSRRSLTDGSVSPGFRGPDVDSVD
jgi:hypothetical protein